MKTFFNDLFRLVLSHYQIDIELLANLLDRHPSRIRHWKTDSRPSKDIIDPLITSILTLLDTETDHDRDARFVDLIKEQFRISYPFPIVMQESLLNEKDHKIFLFKLLHLAYDIKVTEESLSSLDDLHALHPYMLHSILSGTSDKTLYSGKTIERLHAIHPLLSALSPSFSNETKSIIIFEEVIKKLELEPTKYRTTLTYFKTYLALLHTRLLEYGDLPYHYSQGSNLYRHLYKDCSYPHSRINEVLSLVDFGQYHLELKYSDYCYAEPPSHKSFPSAFRFSGLLINEKRANYLQHLTIYKQTQKKKELLLAISTVKEALSECDINMNPYLYMDLQHKLGEALVYYHESSPNTTIYEQAKFALCFAQEIFLEDKFPHRYREITQLLTKLRKDAL